MRSAVLGPVPAGRGCAAERAQRKFGVLCLPEHDDGGNNAPPSPWSPPTGPSTPFAGWVKALRAVPWGCQANQRRRSHVIHRVAGLLT
jgi:hypothetical protein